ncbi:alpha/beta fold hydrolase [Rugosimonospora africana]|uniref:Carboxylesterase n=1 Tax=Rugosimonospora africana TaxID=556532 RepID=A0A8J3QUJ8_9ACTN|nr:alpha/beta hydrolase [Rugosimonospora africana]GIH16282.1 carboxylesterase [Rugosimonospora africana]
MSHQNGSPQVNDAFLARYDAMLARWPVPHESVDVPGRHGTTRVNVCGVPDGPAVLLLHGGGSTSTVWWRTVGALAGTHRVVAVDVIGDSGRSVYDGEPITGLPDLMRWLDDTLDSLGVSDAVVVAHSYGGWLATQFALHAPRRVGGLVLLDPTECLCTEKLSFRLRAIPLFLSPSDARRRSFIRWETGGRELDQQWLELWSMSFGGPTKLVWPKLIRGDRLATLAAPVLLVLAGASRQNPTQKMANVASRVLPAARVVTLPDATHFTLPQQHPDEINALLREFLDERAGARKR